MRICLLLGFGALLLLSGGCTPHRPPPASSGTSALLASLQATTSADSVHFVLQVTNTSTEPMNLEFGSGQSFDFVVQRAGKEIWRWSDGQMFSQALRTEALPPGATLTYTGAWAPPPEMHGNFDVLGILTTRPKPIEQWAHFRIP